METSPEYKLLVSTMREVIPNVVIGSFRLTEELVNEMPQKPAQNLALHVGKTISCFAIPIEEDSLWVWHKHGENRSLFANYILAKAAQAVIDRLKAIGLRAVEITELVGQEISMVKLGELAGLGKRGWNNLLIHPELGSWIQLHAIVSNVRATSAVELKIDTCIHCGNCINACPVNALRPREFNATACSAVVASPTMRKSKAIALTQNSYIECRECISNCPIGSEPERIFEWKI